MKRILNLLDQIALYLIPAGYLLLVFYIQQSSSLSVILNLHYLIYYLEHQI